MYTKLDQAGAVLVVSLLMLTVMTLIAVSGMQSSGLQTLMSGNMQDEIIAFEAAESALRAAEAFLDAGRLNLDAFDSDPSDGLLADLSDRIWQAGTVNWQSQAVAAAGVAGYPQKGGVGKKPRYVIQHLGAVASQAQANLNAGSAYHQGRPGPVIQMFKITARGTGGTDRSVVVLESVYGVSS